MCVLVSNPLIVSFGYRPSLLFILFNRISKRCPKKSTDRVGYLKLSFSFIATGSLINILSELKGDVLVHIYLGVCGFGCGCCCVSTVSWISECDRGIDEGLEMMTTILSHYYRL